MNSFDERLNELRQKIARKKHLEHVLDDMKKQCTDLVKKVDELDSVKLKEEHDVEKLEGGSLAGFFYNVVGKKDEKLDKERQEAYAAKVKYDSAFAELQALKADIDQVEYELNTLQNCDDDYQKTWQEKADWIKRSNTVETEELQKLEDRLTYLSSQEVELQEAIAAGDMALVASGRALSSLDDADDWSTWDMLGGGIFVDVMKHGSLDEAQDAIQTMQIRLHRFKTELADVTLHTDINVKIEGFLHFADWFFDGLFVDWMVRDEIHQSIDCVQQTHNQIRSVISKLRDMMDKVLEEKETLKNKMDQIVLNSK